MFQLCTRAVPYPIASFNLSLLPKFYWSLQERTTCYVVTRFSNTLCIAAVFPQVSIPPISHQIWASSHQYVVVVTSESLTMSMTIYLPIFIKFCNSIATKHLFLLYMDSHSDWVLVIVHDVLGHCSGPVCWPIQWAIEINLEQNCIYLKDYPDTWLSMSL